MNFFLLLIINIALLAIMYLVLRHQFFKNFNSEKFLKTLQSEVNNIITDFNQSAEMNVQILNNSMENLQNLKEKVEKRISELQQIFTIIDKLDGRYNDLKANIRINTQQNAVSMTSVQESGHSNEKSSYNRKKIIELYSNGKSVQDISSITNVPIGEVELIIEFSK